LSSEDARDVDGVSGRGTDTVKVGNESGANSSVSKMSFHHAELALGTIFPLVKLNSLAFYRLEFTLMRLIPINISNNTGILEIDDGVVDEELGSGGGMENVEVIVFDPRAIEVRGGVCTCMEGDRKLGVTPFASSYKVSVNPNLPISNVARHLILPVLVEEDKWVLLCITAVILTPCHERYSCPPVSATNP